MFLYTFFFKFYSNLSLAFLYTSYYLIYSYLIYMYYYCLCAAVTTKISLLGSTNVLSYRDCVICEMYFILFCCFTKEILCGRQSHLCLDIFEIMGNINVIYDFMTDCSNYLLLQHVVTFQRKCCVMQQMVVTHHQSSNEFLWFYFSK